VINMMNELRISDSNFRTSYSELDDMKRIFKAHFVFVDVLPAYNHPVIAIFSQMSVNDIVENMKAFPKHKVITFEKNAGYNVLIMSRKAF